MKRWYEFSTFDVVWAVAWMTFIIWQDGVPHGLTDWTLTFCAFALGWFGMLWLREWWRTR